MKKIGILAFALVFAFGALGVGYAHWSQTLFVTGMVDTGSFNVGITEVTCAEKHIDPASGLPVDGEWEGKEVGDYDWWWEVLKEDPITGKVGYEHVYFTVTDAYPGYRFHVTIKVDNLGTIPAHFVELLLSGRNVTKDRDLTFEWDEGYEYEKGVFKDEGVVIVNMQVVNFVCHQLEPCHWMKGEVDFHFKQEIEQENDYSFDVELEAVQWNMAP